MANKTQSEVELKINDVESDELLQQMVANGLIEPYSIYTTPDVEGSGGSSYDDTELRTLIGTKLDAANPTGTGTLSLNRKASTTTGSYSVSLGYNTTASGSYSHAQGYYTSATGSYSHSQGYYSSATSNSAHAEGYRTTASGYYAHAEGYYTIAQRKSQHVFGEYNILDTEGSASARGKYVEIVGNGSSSSARGNARTLDWSGNETIMGNLQAAGLTDGTTTKTMSEILAGGSAILRRWTD